MPTALTLPTQHDQPLPSSPLSIDRDLVILVTLPPG